MAELRPIDAANLLASQAVACATAFLDGRHDAATLARNAARLRFELQAKSDASARSILDLLGILATAMLGTAEACAPGTGDVIAWARQDRWRSIMRELTELVRVESRALLVGGDGR